MNIAICSWESMHSIAVGGLAAHVSELASALAARGHELHIFTRMGEGQGRYDFLDGVHYHRCPFDPGTDFNAYVDRMCDSFVWHLRETEAFLRRPFDVVHGHDWMTVPALVRLKNECGRNVVFTVHSTEYGRCGNHFSDDPMSRRIRHLEWEGAYVAGQVICVSQALSREMQWLYGVPATKICTIYNGVNVNKYKGRVDIRRVRRTCAIGADDPFVLFAGRMAWQKGPDILLEAIPALLSDFPRARFVFAGDGDMRGGLESRAEFLCNGNARFLGHQRGQRLVDLFKSADVVCVPSRNEPFGIVILEAWSAGKPVVATRTGGPAEFVRDNQTGVTVDPSVPGVQGGLSQMLSDRDSAKRMGVNGRREAQARFTWDHAALALEAVYLSTIQLCGSDLSSAGPVGSEHDRIEGVYERSRQRIMSEYSRSTSVTNDQIRKRAEQIYRDRGSTPGDPIADWLLAERELRAGTLPPANDYRQGAGASLGIVRPPVDVPTRTPAAGLK